MQKLKMQILKMPKFENFREHSKFEKKSKESKKSKKCKKMQKWNSEWQKQETRLACPQNTRRRHETKTPLFFPIPSDVLFLISNLSLQYVCSFLYF